MPVCYMALNISNTYFRKNGLGKTGSKSGKLCIYM